MRGKKTDIETKAKIAELRITKWMQWTDIADELWVNERTVQRVIENEVSEVVAESDLIQSIIRDAVEASKVMWEITLTMAKDIKNRQVQADEWAEWFKPTTDEIRTLNATVSEWFKRSQLLQWKSTENVNILWDVLQQLQWLKENN